MSSFMSAVTEQSSTFKVVVVGQRAVGKTSLAVRYVQGKFSAVYAVTIGIEFYSKVITHGQEQYNLQIWDTTGQESFRSLVRSFYNQASCIVIAYCDPARMTEAIETYLKEIGDHASSSACIFVVRTKTDVCPITEDQISYLEEMISRGLICSWMAVSSKSDSLVAEFFKMVEGTLIRQYHENQEFRGLVDARRNKKSIVLSKTSVQQTTQVTTSKVAVKKGRCCA